MGSARVQYELERTLPAIQLAARHGVFDKDVELRSITQKRRQFENALTRHNAVVGDFVTYIEYEQKLSILQNKRIERLVELEDIPRTDIHTLQNQTKAHIISIYERGVRRLRHDLDFWLRYLEWAKQQKMRSAVSKISARALALFPRSLKLWLAVSDYELNENISADTARALLQRAIRINSITHPHAAESVGRQKLKKRTKKGLSSVETQSESPIRPTGSEALDTPCLLLRPDEKALIHLWLEYIRMELVFLERLRRRRAVLDILEEESKASKAKDSVAGIENVPENDDDAPAPMSIAQIVAEEKREQSVDSQTETTLLYGAIPIASIKSAISLDSTSSLPPQSHFAFLLVLSNLFNEFPFQGDSEKVRYNLNNAVIEALEQRYQTDAISLLMLSILPIIQETYPDAGTEGVKDEAEELSEFKRASRLTISTEQCREASAISTESVRAVGTAASSTKAVEILAEVVFARLSLTEDRSKSVIAIRDALQSMRAKVLQLEEIADRHISTQIVFIQAIRTWAIDMDLGTAFLQYLDAFSELVWKDAKNRDVKGSYMTYAKVVQQLRNAKDVHTIKDTVKLALDKHACANLDDSRFIVLAAEALESASKDGRLSQREADNLWKSVLKSRNSDSVLAVWQAWCRTISASRAQTEREAKIMSALEEHGNLSVEVRKLLTEYLVPDRLTWEAIARIEKWCERQGASCQDIERRLIDVASERYQEEQSNEAMRIKAEKRIRALYDRLIRRSSSVQDAVRFLQFLYFDLGCGAEASTRFLALSQTFAKDDYDKKLQLEDAWRSMIMNSGDD